MPVMSLLSLPIELLQAIAAFTVPEGIKSFTLSCKTLHEVAKGLLPEHHSLRKQYRCYKFPQRPVGRHHLRARPAPEDDNGDVRSTMGLLVSIAKNPVIARYIEVADFRSSDDEIWAGNANAAWEILKKDPARKDMVLRFLRESHYLAQAQIDPAAFLDNVIHDPESLDLKAFLLTLLPNLRDLVPSDRWKSVFGPREGEDSEGTLWRILDAIAQRANDPSTRDGAALAKLERLRTEEEPEYDLRVILQGFTPLLSLPKLRTFYGASLLAFCDYNTGTKMLDTRYKWFGQALETLWMEGCCIDDGNIREMLSTCPKIKEFRFSFETKWHGCGFATDMGHFVQAIEETTYDRLEHLLIEQVDCMGGTGTGVVSMKRFEKLKTIKLSIDCLQGPPCGGEVDINWDSDDYDVDEGNTARGDNETPPLTEILPASVEEITFISKTEEKHLHILGKLFHGIEASSLELTLPNLRKVLVQIDTRDDRNATGLDIKQGSLWKATKEAIESAGGQVDPELWRGSGKWDLPPL